MPAPEHLTTLSSPELAAAKAAAESGASIVVDYFEKGVTMRSKGPDEHHNLVSDADEESEAAIIESLTNSLPGHTVFGEESAKNETAEELNQVDHLWIVDPLDGTNNFAHHLPHFAISLGYYRRGVAAAGLVVNPVRDDWYYAVSGGGAWHNGEGISVRNDTSLSSVMVGCGFYYDRGQMMQATLKTVEAFFGEGIHGIRRFGTAALDLCQVAAGQFGAFFEYQLAPWDFAAARLILEEAGGKITDARGEPLALKISSILASNTVLHEDALALTRRFHP
ncbi:MAG TPA: inositol monophosphatase [Planctomycetaceae bacterium]|nr:inositol monophosphatase [Planctomycetaceae bacterium]